MWYASSHVHYDHVCSGNCCKVAICSTRPVTDACRLVLIYQLLLQLSFDWCFSHLQSAMFFVVLSWSYMWLTEIIGAARSVLCFLKLQKNTCFLLSGHVWPLPIHWDKHNTGIYRYSCARQVGILFFFVISSIYLFVHYDSKRLFPFCSQPISPTLWGNFIPFFPIVCCIK